MKCLKKIVVLLIIFLSFNIKTVLADEIEYKIIDYSDESLSVLFSSSNYNEAYSFYLNNVGKYQNLCMNEGDETILMEYGTLYISNGIGEVTYHSAIQEKDRVLTNYNDYDLLYIGESSDVIEFAIGGDIGLINKEEVEYCPYNSHSVSYYDCQNDSLVHHVASSTNNYYKYYLALDLFPDYLDKEKKYYSFDNHYFYDDFYSMTDDFYKDIHTNAVNAKSPYYNYYAYLPSRSYTSYSYSELNDFFTTTLGINGRLDSYNDFDRDGANDVVNKSEYFNNIKAFTSAEKIYGVNAFTSLAWSIEESAYGKSLNSYLTSNVFNHEAFEGEEIKNNKYSSINSSIYSHAKNYVSKKYCDEFSSDYVGSYIGSFISGIASSYSNDPLFSEKVVSKAYFLDSSLDFKDRNQYTLGIANKRVTLFYDKDLSTSFDSIGLKEYSLIILDEIGDVYKVQCDYAMNQTGKYNPQKSIAYVKKSLLNKINEGSKKDIKYNEYVLNINDTKEYLYSINEYDIENEFVYKDGTENYVLNENTYELNEKTITSVEFKGLNYPSFNVNGPIIKNGKILITYDDGSQTTKNITSDTIAYANNSDSITTIGLTYKGINNEVKLQGDYDIYNNGDFESFIKYNEDNYSKFGFYDIKQFDSKFVPSEDLNISTFIKENDFNFSVAGAYPSFIYHSTDQLASIINTYYFETKRVPADVSTNNILNKYGLEYIDGLDVEISRCFYEIDLKNPVVMQAYIPHSNNLVYSVFHKNSNGDIIKCPTQFSDNDIRFLANESGTYYVYSYPSASVYSSEDKQLAINSSSNGVDYYAVAREGLIYIVVTACGYALFGLYFKLNGKEKKRWNDFKKSLQQAESVQEEMQSN